MTRDPEPRCVRDTLGFLLLSLYMSDSARGMRAAKTSNESYRAYLPLNSPKKILTNRGGPIWLFRAINEPNFPK
ncbi:hypothetical protein SAMN05428962_4118 [Paenibacillus sp. BC26]|nr:hypothetical protein SAMN05428962_4118 [Paenibacillus sp. BC26]